MQILDPFIKKCAGPSSLMRTTCRPWLSELDVSARPLLQQYRQQGTGKSYNQTQRPKRIDPDGGFRWRESERVRLTGKGGDLSSIRVGKELINVLEIECRLVLRIWSKVLNRYCKECRNDGREESRLQQSCQHMMDNNIGTHKDQGITSYRLPVFCPLPIPYLGHLQIHVEERPITTGIAGLSLYIFSCSSDRE